jgi:hypothetical protein
MDGASAADVARTWQTDRMTFLDSPELINKTVKLLNGAIPGTNKPSDAQKISDELVQMLFAEMKDSRGVDADKVLATLGSLAGFSVQMSLREALVKTGKIPEDKLFLVVKTKDGETYYLGDALNEGLFENKPGNFSVYSIVGGGVQKAGAKELPDVIDIVKYVAGTLGTEKYGIPRMPDGHMLRERPVELLNKFWNPTRNFLVLNVKAPLQWPFVIALAAQKVIFMSKDALDPALAGKLVMETAIAMAKVDPAKIHFASFQSY